MSAGAAELAETILDYLDDPYKAPELVLALIRESCVMAIAAFQHEEMDAS